MASSYLSRARLAVSMLSIACNAIIAGGIFTFPIMSPSLAMNLKLSQTRLTSIALAGMIGQYPASAIVGSIIDAYGPWVCSLLAGGFFGIGFGFFSWEISKTPAAEVITAHDIQSSFHLLVFLFFLCGLGTVNSYFSSLFAATKSFPNHPGLASGVSLSLFGLSPLFLSYIAGNFFRTDDEGLDVTGYTRFLAVTTVVVHLFGALAIHVPPVAATSQPESSEGEVNESAPLLPNAKEPALLDPKTNISGVLRDPSFWGLALVMGMTLGSSEMVISNIGTIVLSLPANRPRSAFFPMDLSSVDSATAATARQVRLLSLSNTLSRLTVGFLVDWISPVGNNPNAKARGKGRLISRLIFLIAFSIILTASFSYAASMMHGQDAVWLLSVGVGIPYGAMFTIIPSLVFTFWGITNLARNFGLLVYAPFVFTPAFSYLYAFISEAHTPLGLERVCYGVDCWRTTFVICAAGCGLASITATMLWQRWKTQV